MSEQVKVDEGYYKWALNIIQWVNSNRSNLQQTTELAKKLQDDMEEFALFWYCDECERIHPDNIADHYEPRYNEGYL